MASRLDHRVEWALPGHGSRTALQGHLASRLVFLFEVQLTYNITHEVQRLSVFTDNTLMKVTTGGAYTTYPAASLFYTW